MHEDRMNVMSEADYDSERARIKDAYGDNKTSAGIRFEQALARLFAKCGRPQEWLAEKERKSQRWVSYQLIFGRFLDSSTVCASSLPTDKLTEGKFRSYWDRTENNKAVGDKWDQEDARFAEIVTMMQEEVTLRKGRVQGLRLRIVDFMNGKGWKELPTIAAGVEEPEDLVRSSLDKIERGEAPGLRGEKKQYGKTWKYRIYKSGRDDKVVSVVELEQRLTPILEGFIAEGKKSAVTASPGAVAILAHKLQKLLEEWAGTPDRRHRGDRQAHEEVQPNG